MADVLRVNENDPTPNLGPEESLRGPDVFEVRIFGRADGGRKQTYQQEEKARVSHAWTTVFAYRSFENAIDERDTAMNRTYSSTEGRPPGLTYTV